MRVMFTTMDIGDGKRAVVFGAAPRINNRATRDALLGRLCAELSRKGMDCRIAGLAYLIGQTVYTHGHPWVTRQILSDWKPRWEGWVDLSDRER